MSARTAPSRPSCSPWRPPPRCTSSSRFHVRLGRARGRPSRCLTAAAGGRGVPGTPRPVRPSTAPRQRASRRNSSRLPRRHGDRLGRVHGRGARLPGGRARLREAPRPDRPAGAQAPRRTPRERCRVARPTPTRAGRACRWCRRRHIAQRGRVAHRAADQPASPAESEERRRVVRWSVARAAGSGGHEADKAVLFRLSLPPAGATAPLPCTLRAPSVRPMLGGRTRSEL